MKSYKDQLVKKQKLIEKALLDRAEAVKATESLQSQVRELKEKFEQATGKYNRVVQSSVSVEQYNEAVRLSDSKDRQIAELKKTVEAQSDLTKNLAKELSEARTKAMTNLAEKLGLPATAALDMLRQGATDEMIERYLKASKPKIQENIPVFSIASIAGSSPSTIEESRARSLAERTAKN